MDPDVFKEVPLNRKGDELTDEQKLIYNKLIKKGKECTECDRIYDGYRAYKKAFSLMPADKLKRKLQKMEAYLTENKLWPSGPDKNDAESRIEKRKHSEEKDENKENVNNGPQLSDQDKIQFDSYIKQGKELTQSDDIYESYMAFRKAYSINPVDKLSRRLQRMKTYLDENDLWPKESPVKSIEKEQSTSSVSSPNDKRCSPPNDNSSSLTNEKTSIEEEKANTSNFSCEKSPKHETENEKDEVENEPGESDEDDEQESVDRFNDLIAKGKEETKAGNLTDALDSYKEAQKLFPSDKLQKRITKIEEFLAEQEKQDNESEDEGGEDMVHMGNGFYLYKDLYNNIYEHQRQGVLWMWGLHKKRKGGILGDDMGLGKTVQVISFLSGMFDSERIKSVLIVLPVAVMVNWEREFTKWAPGIQLENFHTNTKREKVRALQKVARRGGVVLTSYGMLVRPENTQMLNTINGTEFTWDYIILDEGHKIKNPSAKCSKGIHSIPARHRLILTGTPIQNNLKEMWTLFDWTHQGTLLGTAKSFSMQFEAPIQRARQKDATMGEQRVGQQISNLLRDMIAPYFMRRTKAEVSQKEKAKGRRGETDGEHGDKVKRSAPDMPTMTRKNDLVCWVFLSEIQEKIYTDFISLDEIKQLLNTSKSPLVALTQLKKICDHPRLLTLNQCHKLGLDIDEGMDVEEQSEEVTSESAASRIEHIADNILVEESGKMRFLVALLDNLKLEGHRCLVFSQSRKVLDIIQKVITNRGHRVARLDGTVRHLHEREEIIKKFSNNPAYSVFLLTTQVGGVGLTLTAADRVVIFDPSWNPATDAQAVDRAFRIGQQKNVVIYRLITCGSVEEKIYRRQIFKDSITKQTTGESNNPYRYFSRQELYELFRLDNTRHSSTQTQLVELQRGQRKTDTSLDAHIAFLHTLEMFGVSDHDLMFNREAVDAEEEEHERDQGYIQTRVAEAKRIISIEAEENEAQAAQDGRYMAPEVFSFKERGGMKQPPTQQFQPRSDFSGASKYIDDAAMETDMNTSLDRVHISEARDAQNSSHISINDTPTQTPTKSSVTSPASYTSSERSASHTSQGDVDMQSLVPQGLSEEEQIQLAMQLSMLPDQDQSRKQSANSCSPNNSINQHSIYASPQAVASPRPQIAVSPRSQNAFSPRPTHSEKHIESPATSTHENSFANSPLRDVSNTPPVSKLPREIQANQGASGFLARMKNAVKNVIGMSPAQANESAPPTNVSRSPDPELSPDQDHSCLNESRTSDDVKSQESTSPVQNSEDIVIIPEKSFSKSPKNILNTSDSSSTQSANVSKTRLDQNQSLDSDICDVQSDLKPDDDVEMENENVTKYFTQNDVEELKTRTESGSPEHNYTDTSKSEADNEPTKRFEADDVTKLYDDVTNVDRSAEDDKNSVIDESIEDLDEPVQKGNQELTETTQFETPSKMKNKRRSVNVGLKPPVQFLSACESPPKVVREELIFSPRHDEPQVISSPHRHSSETVMGYETFMDNVQSRPNCNSTTIGEMRKMSFGEEEEDEEQENEQTDDEDEEEESEEEEELTEEEEQRYRNFVLESRKCYKAGNLVEAIKLVTQALQIYSGDPTVLAYADKLSRKFRQAQNTS